MFMTFCSYYWLILNLNIDDTGLVKENKIKHTFHHIIKPYYFHIILLFLFETKNEFSFSKLVIPVYTLLLFKLLVYNSKHCSPTSWGSKSSLY